MLPERFWISQDGNILSLTEKSPTVLSMVLAFKFQHPEDLAFARNHLEELQFTERSSLARIGIEMITLGPPTIDRKRILLPVESFVYDPSFPNTPYFKKLLRPGTPAGRLFYAPEAAKLSSDEIWKAIRENRIKLPNTISVDRFGRVFLTPHRARYRLMPDITQIQFERIVNGDESRSFLDKVQVREEMDVLSIAPRSGILASCSMYLKEHYVVLNRGPGNFGLHCGAVLLDPFKTFGTNVMLEIYNTSDQVVVNPVVSVDVFRAPPPPEGSFKPLQRRRRELQAAAGRAFRCLDDNPPIPTAKARPRLKISVRGQSVFMQNVSRLVCAGTGLMNVGAKNGVACGFQTLVQALEQAPPNADTLIVDYFPNLPEHIELLTRLQQVKLRKLIFRKPSRTHGFFLSSNAHARLDTYEALNIKVYWYNEALKDIFIHVYRKQHGFFVREEMISKLHGATILAFYGSAARLDAGQSEKIQRLIARMTGFFGPTVGILTGGGGGVMGVATDHARETKALVGACFLELESQPPNVAVDFFNTFQETSRHYRQKWFEAADFCIFNVGGVGTLEEVGIELCNLKLGIRPPIPYIFYNGTYWRDLKRQLQEMIRTRRAPAWLGDYILFTDDPDEVVAFYRKKLQIL